ncbi:MAG: hypothetical protein IT383_05490 [Deltaproteobacteria bacterium]|nr:hypothetical protein [Deltaproteobacteria bacterium]
MSYALPCRSPCYAVLVAAALAGCPQGTAVAPGHADEDPGPAGSTLCEVQELFAAQCVACHDGSTPPDLRDDAVLALVGQPSVLHPERVLVVAGDPEGSFLYAKITAVSDGDGDLMPLGAELDDSQRETVRAWIAAGATASCELAGEGEGEGDPGGEGEGEGENATACAVLSNRCASCHNGGAIDVDLRADAQQELVGAASPGYPGEMLVVAGDPDASFLYRKMAGTQGPNRRGIMPPDGAVGAAELALVRAWIADGALDDCSASPPPPPPPPPPLEPGGDISEHIGAPSLVAGFSDRVPSGVTGSCSTDQYWQFGNAESSRMHPGRACLECHQSEGEGPRRGFLGTVTQTVDDSNDCRGVGDVRVDIIDDDDGSVLATATTNSAGNFIIESSTLCTQASCPPYRVRLTLDGRTRDMLAPQTSGDCNACHSAAGSEGAPGRIVAP